MNAQRVALSGPLGSSIILAGDSQVHQIWPQPIWLLLYITFSLGCSTAAWHRVSIPLEIKLGIRSCCRLICQLQLESIICSKPFPKVLDNIIYWLSLLLCSMYIGTLVGFKISCNKQIHDHLGYEYWNEVVSTMKCPNAHKLLVESS